MSRTLGVHRHACVTSSALLRMGKLVMKRIVAVVLLIAVVAIGIGFYRGWISLQNSGSENSDGKVQLGVDVDTDKAQSDLESLKPSGTSP